MLVRLLAPVVVTGLVLNAAPAGAQAVTQHLALAADSNFMQTAGSLGLLQVKLGALAEKKGSSPVVREFGRRMVADYSRANEELAAGAEAAAYPEPVMLREHKQLLDRFIKTGRSSFDKKYMSVMIDQHGEVARLFRAEAEQGRVVSLRQLAVRLLPTVQQHVSLATMTAGSIGADVTATAEGARAGSPGSGF